MPASPYSAKPPPAVTWAALKRAVEAAGVEDSTKVFYLGLAVFWRTATVKVRARWLADGQVEILFSAQP